MNILIILIIVVSSITNMLADLFLTSGKRKSRSEDLVDIFRNTPEKHLIISGIVGLSSIILWTSVLYFLIKIPNNIGFFICFSFAAYICCLATFHVVCSYSFLIVKCDESKLKTCKKMLGFYGIMCLVTSIIYSFLMVYISIIGIIDMNIFQYLTLPIFSTILIQYIFGKIIFKNKKYFSSISGTFSMMIAFLSTISIIMANFP